MTAEERALEVYPKMSRISEPHGVIPADYESHYIGDANAEKREGFIEGYHQAEKDVAEAFARIIRGNLGRIGNDIQNMFEQLYTDITGEKMYKGFKD